MLCLFAVLATACGGSGDDSTPTDTATSAPPASTTPSPSPTPDALADIPADAATALAALEGYFGASRPECTEDLQRRWSVTCLTGDFDADRAQDLAMLVPLAAPGLRSPNPAVVVVARAAAAKLEQFPPGRSEADASELGLALFAAVDRSGDILPELSYLTRTCTASTCKVAVQIQRWDGNAWRDIGPADNGIENPERVEFSGAGEESQLVMRGGQLASMGAGPTRPRTVTYRFDGTRYSAVSVEHDPPAYLYHAILDADQLFDEAVRTHGQFDAAITAYRAALDNPNLLDWKYEAEGLNGRRELRSYALFRIALATAADGQNPTAALDQVITAAEEEIFRRVAVTFRQGYQQDGRPEDGCLEVTSYLAIEPLPGRIAEMFDYGTANPSKSVGDICPL